MNNKFCGTGFLVSPKNVLTCAHVVESISYKSKGLPAGSNVTVFWQGNNYDAAIKSLFPNPYPDLALLDVNINEHPCVYLYDFIEIGDELYCYGYSDESMNGDSALFVYEGPYNETQPFYKLKNAQARPGLSGSPLLNLNTGTVCGILKRSRDIYSDLGGLAVPTRTIFKFFEKLEHNQSAYHKTNEFWIKCLRSSYGRNVECFIFNEKDLLSNINSYTLAYVNNLTPSRIVPLQCHLKRNIETEIINWINYNTRGFATIIGSAGIGKTHLLCDIVRKLISYKRYPVIFLRCDDLYNSNIKESILRYYAFDKRYSSLFDLFSSYDRLNGKDKRIVICLDTLDLLSDRCEINELLIDLSDFNCLVLGAIRPHEFEIISDLVIKTFNVQLLNDRELRQIVPKFIKYYSLNDLKKISAKQKELCRTPLHLKMFIEIYDERKSMPDEMDVHSLFFAFWETKISNVRVGANIPKHINKTILKEKKKQICLKIAYGMFLKGTLTFNFIDSEVEEFVSNELENIAFDQLISEGILRFISESISFFHQSFWEFLVGYAIATYYKTDYLFQNFDFVLYRGVCFHLALLAKRLKKDEIFYEVCDFLKRPYYLNNILLVDIILSIPKPDQSEIDILEYLCEKEKIFDYFLSVILHRGPNKDFSLLFRLLEDSSVKASVEIRRRICESLPKLIEVDPYKTTKLMYILREDYDIKYRSDNRRRVIEALPDLYDSEPKVTIELLKFRDKDEIYTTIAAVETIIAIFGFNKKNNKRLLEELINKIEDTKERSAIDFLINLLIKIETSPKEALKLVTSNQFNDNLLVQICISRNLTNLMHIFPDDIIEIMEKYINPTTHRNVRRPLARAAPNLIDFLKNCENKSLKTRLEKLFECLCLDNDEIIRLTVTDCIDDLADINPTFAAKIIKEKLIFDDNDLIKLRSFRTLCRLSYTLGENKEELRDFCFNHGTLGYSNDR